jgi:hypothetical protein
MLKVVVLEDNHRDSVKELFGDLKGEIGYIERE